jgi:hypothetical protein
VLVAVGILCLCATGLQAATVRVFGVGYKQRLADAVTYQTFRDKMFALMDATYPGRAALVQAGLDDVASHIQPADPAAPAGVLVNFPEDAGLIAGLIGSRGAMARAQPTSATAIVSLAGAYGALVTHYTAQFGNRHPVSDVFVAATDTFYRAFYETYRDLAMTYGVHVTASADIAPARRVEEADDAALVALLRDPDEPGRTYAYEATSPVVRNVVFIFAPDGEILVPQPDGSTLRSPSETGGVILPSISKAYPTELELTLLGLTPTAMREMDVVDTPVGRIGVVISKDAWMIDVNDRFEAKNAQLLLQSEAFQEWGFQAGEWWPDIFKEGGFGNLQKNPSFLFNIAPSLTGHLFEITFDGQTTILQKKTKTDPGPLSSTNAWIGQNADSGFLRMGPWIVDDPGIASPALTLAARRSQLTATGVNLLPGSGVPCATDLTAGACENGYREAVIHADVVLPDGEDVLTLPDLGPRVPTAFEPSIRVNPPDGGGPSLQKNARVVARRRRVAVVWQDTRDGLPTIYLATSRDAGLSFEPPVKVSDNAPGSVAELLPDVGLGGSSVHVVWQELASGSDEDAGRIQHARFNLRGGKRGADVRVDSGAEGVGRWRPAVAAASGRVYVTWVDERDTGPDGIAFEHIYLAVGRHRGRSFEAPRRIDVGAPVALAERLDNKWAPSITAYKRTVSVAWTDFRNYNWDIFTTTSQDRGGTFGPNVRVDDFGTGIERLHGNPAIALAQRGDRLVVAWPDLRAREPDTNVFFTTSVDAGVSYAANVQLDSSRVGFDPDSDTPSSQWAPRLAARRNEVCAVWQDNRRGNNDIFFTSSNDGGATFALDERADDTGAGISNQYNPDVAITRQSGQTVCYAVWEDTRDGDSDVYLATRRLP